MIKLIMFNARFRYIAIILENFNQAHQEEEIGIVEEDLEMFYTKWAK